MIYRIGIALLAACLFGGVAHAKERYVSPPFSAGVCAGLKATYSGRASAIAKLVTRPASALAWPCTLSPGGQPK